MAWKECSVMDERLRFVAKLLDGDKIFDRYSCRHLCHRVGQLTTGGE
jgi:hypothetical protein